MISDEAVEAAAKVLCEQMWENAHEKQRAYARDEAREALEAAAPHMRAQALEAAAAIAADGGVPAYDSDEWAGWLRARAAMEHDVAYGTDAE